MSSERELVPDDPERDRGILTQADRELLLDDKELQPQSEREARQRIRNRLENALLDIQLLHRRIRESDRESVADSTIPDSDEGNLLLMENLAFMFRLVMDTSGDMDRSLVRYKEGNQDAVESELRRVEKNVLIDVEVSIDIDGRDPDHDALIQKFENDEETLEELMYLRREGIIEDYERYFDHLIPRLWENERTVAFPTEEGMDVLEPSEYDSVGEFREAYQNMITRAANQLSSEDEQ